MKQDISLIGAPTDIGAGARGASMGPEAMRVAGIVAILQGHGLSVIDRGNLVGPANPWLPPVDGYRHLAEVVQWNQLVHDAVYAELRLGRLPIVLVGREFWTKLVNFDWLVETGMISADDLQLFHLVDSAEEAWQILVQAFALDAPETETGEFADDI